MTPKSLSDTAQLSFDEFIDAAKASTKGFTPSGQTMRLAAAMGEIAATFATPHGVKGDGKALAQAIGKAGFAIVGTAHLLAGVPEALQTPTADTDKQFCGEEIAADLVAYAGDIATANPESDVWWDTQSVLNLLATLIVSVAGEHTQLWPDFVQCCNLYHHNETNQSH